VQEIDEVLTKARMFQYKPDGDVTFMTFQDAQGVPISTFQDPLLYPHSTKFLAPGRAVSRDLRCCAHQGVIGRSKDQQ